MWNTEDESRKKLWSDRAEVFYADAQARQSSAGEAAQAALKGIFLANGGAILALLTLIGNTGIEVDGRAIWWAFVWYSIGLVAVIMAHWTRYRELGLFTIQGRYVAIQLQNPEFATEFQDRRDRSGKLAFRFRRTTEMLVLASSGLFVAGSFVALGGVL